MKQKTVLLLGGFPGLFKNHPVFRYIRINKWKLVNPDLFCDGRRLTVENIVKEVTLKLGNKTPDIIIAISFGGLLAPVFAEMYPDAYCLLIATGPRMSMDLKIYNKFARRGNTKLLRSLFGIGKRVPIAIFRIAYRIVNPYKAGYQDKLFYYENILESYNNIKKISPLKFEELAQFVRGVDNTKLLKVLKNRTLIITGDRDVMMPRRLSFELKSLIPNSELIENFGRLHFDVFDERDFSKVDRFLGL